MTKLRKLPHSMKREEVKTEVREFTSMVEIVDELHELVSPDVQSPESSRASP